jgi:hypothetical protein
MSIILSIVFSLIFYAPALTQRSAIDRSAPRSEHHQPDSAMPTDEAGIPNIPRLVDFDGGWMQIPDAAVSDAFAIVYDDLDVLHMAMRSTDDEITYRARSAGGVLSDVTNLGGRTFHAPDISFNPITGEIIIVVRGIDAKIYQNSKDTMGVWSGWHPILFGATTHGAGVATNSAGETVVRVKSSVDDTIWLDEGGGMPASGGVCTTKVVTLDISRFFFPMVSRLADLQVTNLCDGKTLRV